MQTKNKQVIKDSEGLRLEAYQDIAGIWTIGYGDTGKDVVKGLIITKGEAEKRLDKRLRGFEKGIEEVVKVKLSQNQFDALVSLVYNIGLGNFQESTLLKKLNLSDYEGAANEFPRWNKAWVRGKLKEVEGLTSRRLREQKLFLEKGNAA